MEEHQKEVARIAAHVEQFYNRKESFRIYHGSTNSTRALAYKRDGTIDTSSLNKVLKVDREERNALVEPNVSMRRLLQATLQEGLIPQVVMEFPEITAGGGFSGPSGESSSFKYGYFENTVDMIEIVLGDGKIVTASHTDNPDLFLGAAGSLGTLGVITLLKVRLIEAKEFVRLEYRPVYGVSEAVRSIQTAVTDPTNDFVDGILFALNRGVIVVGRLADKDEHTTRVQTFSQARDPWFYLHAERLFNWKESDSAAVSVMVPLVDYLFRYNRGGFWVGKYAFEYMMTPFNRITRWALDSFMQTSVRVRRGRLGAALGEERREERKRCTMVQRNLKREGKQLGERPNEL
jgi:Delta24-sterol reductase